MTTGLAFCNPRGMASDLPLRGGCNCGEVRYLITRPILTTYICHCHLCQKRTGSAFSMPVVIPADGFDLVQGTLLQTERRSVPECRSCTVKVLGLPQRLTVWHEVGRLSIEASSLGITEAQLGEARALRQCLCAASPAAFNALL